MTHTDMGVDGAGYGCGYAMAKYTSTSVAIASSFQVVLSHQAHLRYTKTLSGA